MPYRYSYAQESEIEHMIQEILEVIIIQLSQNCNIPHHKKGTLIFENTHKFEKYT